MCIRDRYQTLRNELIVLDNDGNELSLPRTEQISKDRFRKGDSLKAVIHKVEMLSLIHI